MNPTDHINRLEQSLACLEKEIDDIKLQLAKIKREASQLETTAPAEPPAAFEPAKTPAAAQKTDAEDRSAAFAPVEPRPASEPKVTVRPTPAPQTTATEKSSSRFEENFGGKVMGIVAALLIFVGLFLFGSMLYERLGDTARIALLFLVSFLLLGAGLFLERKRQSWFTASLTGCGFGAVYISLFITALYFNRLTTEALYILLVFWLAAIGFYVFRRKSYTAALLGQFGITFSVIFGSLGADTTWLFNFLCVYFAVLSLAYLWIVLWRFLPAETEKPYPWIYLTAAALNLVQLWCLAASYSDLYGDYGAIGGRNLFGGILLCLYTYALPLFFLLRQRFFTGLPLLPRLGTTRTIAENDLSAHKADTVSPYIYTVYQFVSCIVFAAVTAQLFSADIPCSFAFFIGILLSWILVELFGASGTEGYGSCVITVLGVMFTMTNFDLPQELQFLFPAVFCLIALAFGLFASECPVREELNPLTNRWELVCKKRTGRWPHRFIAIYCLFPISFSYDTYELPNLFWVIALFGILLLSGSFVFLYRSGKSQRFADAWKKELYLFSILHICRTIATLYNASSLTEVEGLTIHITVLTVLNGIAYYCGFRRSIEHPERSDTWANALVRTTHTILWIIGLALLHCIDAGDYPFLCFWLILLTLYLCGSGLYEQYKKHKEKTGLGVYFGLRLTVYLIAVLTAFEGVEGYVISCALLLLAIAAVLAGFPLRLAPLRVYGLCLAMFAVIKLLMIDVEHDNSMETVLCFLGAGVLCFAINFIYNHVKKCFHNDEV